MKKKCGWGAHPSWGLVMLVGLTIVTLASWHPADAAGIEYFHLAPTFQAETKDANGFAAGTGFTSPNRWGQYTAYILKTDASGKRTWRIEHYLPMRGLGMAQGSTIYLLEGSKSALLIDTGQQAEAVAGKNDLKSVVRFLLGHDNQGSPKLHPVDFVVANTHNHPDHIGENSQMSDRTVYYMDLDWPTDAPPNYVPIRDGGGPTKNGKGQAVGEIELGHRLIKAVAVPPHTPGSTAYLDAANQMLFTGDALGSAWPFIQRGPFSTYARTIHHVDQLTRDFRNLAVLPAHFYQNATWGRNGRPLDRQYIIDQAALADEVLDGTAIGEPFPLGATSMWARHGSAQAVYSLDNLANPNEELPEAYHAVQLHDSLPRQWLSHFSNQDLARLNAIRSDLYLIRERRLGSLFLIRTSESALLVGTGHGSPGLASFLSNLVGPRSLDVLLLSNDEGQTGGLSQLSYHRLYAGHSDAPKDAIRLSTGEPIELGGRGGVDLQLSVIALGLPTRASLTLLDSSDRVLFIDESLGDMTPLHPILVTNSDAFQSALTGWWSQTVGRFDVIYAASSAAWYNSAQWIDSVEHLLTQINDGHAKESPVKHAGFLDYIASAGEDAGPAIEVPVQRN